jgi:hypothetical protein
MRCPLHLTEMQQVKTSVPAFIATGEEGYAERHNRQRTILRCMLPGCHCVAAFYDANRREPLRCTSCGKPVSCSGRKCKACAAKQKRRLGRFA